MKVPVCYEVEFEVTSNAFQGYLWIRGQAILEPRLDRWMARAAVPVVPSAEGAHSIDPLYNITERVRHRLMEMARIAGDRAAFEHQVGQFFATADCDAQDEWLTLASVIGRDSVLEGGLPIDTESAVRPDFRLSSGPGAMPVRQRVFVPGELHRLR